MRMKKDHSLILAALILIGGVTLTASSFAQSITLTAKPPSQTSVEKPAYLHFKDAVITRLTKTKYQFDVTLQAKIERHTRDQIIFYVGFDIDDNAATGETAAASPNFGRDIGVFIIKPAGSNKFDAATNQAEVLGKLEEMKPSNAKVSGDKLTFELRSNLFADYDRFKFFLSSQLVRYDRGQKVGDVQVDTLSSKGAVTFPAAASN
jgi:hypothetical protein